MHALCILLTSEEPWLSTAPPCESCLLLCLVFIYCFALFIYEAIIGIFVFDDKLGDDTFCLLFHAILLLLQFTMIHGAPPGVWIEEVNELKCDEHFPVSLQKSTNIPFFP